MSNSPKRWPHISSRDDLPKREFHSWRGMKEPTTDIYYRQPSSARPFTDCNFQTGSSVNQGAEVYLETEDLARRSGKGEPIFVCHCDTDEWADYIISCLSIREMM